MQNQSLNGRNLIWIAVLRPKPTIIFRYCMLNNFAVARGQEIHGGLSSTSRFEHPINSFSLFFLIYTMINAPMLHSFDLYSWLIVLNIGILISYFSTVLFYSNFSSLSFSTKQNSISIGQKIHTKFHHHYKNTKTTLKRK